MQMDETIIVSSIIHKLSPSGKDFKRSLNHKKEDISFEDLANHLCIEEQYCKQDKNKEQNAHIIKVHVVEKSQLHKPIKKRAYQFTITHKNKKKKKGAFFRCEKSVDTTRQNVVFLEKRVHR